MDDAVTVFVPDGEPKRDSHLYLQQWKDARKHHQCLMAVKKARESTAIAETLRRIEDTMNQQITDDVVVGEVTLPAGTSLAPGMTIPLSQDAAELMYYQSGPSQLGVEGRGTVADSSLRSSMEITIADDDPRVVLPDILKNFAFPGMRARLREALCPTAIEVGIKAYKLVTYAKGDFFTAHVDSMSNEHMFGSLALQIPIVYGPPPSTKDGTTPRNSDAEEDTRESAPQGSSEFDSEEGNLVFYLGRASDVDRGSETQYRNFLYYSGNRGYGRSIVDDVLRLSVDLTTPMPPRPDGAVDLKYAAWLGDVPHEVGRVTQPYRMVLLYRLFKRGDRYRALVPRPIADSISADVRRLLTPAVPHQLSKSNPASTGADAAPGVHCNGTFLPLTVSILPTGAFTTECVGIILRHTYPPAGLKPTALKGVDAAAYQIITATHEVHLLPSVMECRDDYPTQPYRFLNRDEGARYGPFTRRIVLDVRRPDEFRESAFSDTVLLENPYINAVWLQLGYGQIIGGGHSYGNADCGADWWYRSAAMIVLPRSSKWSRVQPLFLAALRGRSETMKRLYAVQDVFQHVARFV